MFRHLVVQRSLQLLLVLSLHIDLSANAFAADENAKGPSNNKDDEKKVLRDVAATVIKAAHPTARKPSIGDYKITMTKKGCVRININVQYHGGFTGVTYLAEIIIDIDPKDKSVQELEFLDVTNTIKANVANLQKSRKLIENQLEKLLVESK